MNKSKWKSSITCNTRKNTLRYSFWNWLPCQPSTRWPAWLSRGWTSWNFLSISNSYKITHLSSTLKVWYTSQVITTIMGARIA